MALHAILADSWLKHLVNVPISFWIARFSWTLWEHLVSLFSVICVERKDRPTLIRCVASCPEGG
jgi:hypothetical protein